MTSKMICSMSFSEEEILTIVLALKSLSTLRIPGEFSVIGFDYPVTAQEVMNSLLNGVADMCRSLDAVVDSTDQVVRNIEIKCDQAVGFGVYEDYARARR